MEQPINQKQTVRLSADGIYRGASVHVPYPLELSDFQNLTKVTSLIPIWAHTFFTATAFFVFTVAAKWIDNKYFGGNSIISNTDIITLCILVLFAMCFEGLYFWFPSAKKNTIKKIEKHFEEHSPLAAGLYDV